ncbi:hypothetical protein Taro_012837, partial [Colocasia esculenta]|nr:hypothetical protein [Colocasia esculenta]
MIASQFMDKQITGLSGAVAHGGDLMELANPGDGHQSNGASTGFREEILPSYDFQPIRRAASPPPPPPHVGIGGGGAWESTDSKPSSSNFRNYGSFEAHESSKVIHERNNTYDMANMVEIDHIVKKYADILLHTLDGVNSRLSQLEGRTYNLETAVDDLKLSIENSGGSTDGKLRQLENILREREGWESHRELPLGGDRWNPHRVLPTAAVGVGRPTGGDSTGLPVGPALRWESQRGRCSVGTSNGGGASVGAIGQSAGIGEGGKPKNKTSIDAPAYLIKLGEL